MDIHGVFFIDMMHWLLFPAFIFAGISAIYSKVCAIHLSHEIKWSDDGNNGYYL